MISRIAELPKVAKGEGAGGWVGRIAQQLDILKETLGSLTEGPGIAITEDGAGRIRIELTAFGGGGGAENYGFMVTVDDNGAVQVAAGTAQIWGGLPKAYAAGSPGQAANGKYVYARCDLTAAPPAWDNTLHYGNSLTQGWTEGDDLVVPIALVNVGSGGAATVTQMHWGNIVSPAVSNVVDVQEESAQAAQEESGA